MVVFMLCVICPLSWLSSCSVLCWVLWSMFGVAIRCVIVRALLSKCHAWCCHAACHLSVGCCHSCARAAFEKDTHFHFVTFCLEKGPPVLCSVKLPGCCHCHCCYSFALFRPAGQTGDRDHPTVRSGSRLAGRWEVRGRY